MYILPRLRLQQQTRHVARTEFSGEVKENLGGNGFALGAISKKKVFTKQKAVLIPNYGEDQKKKGLHEVKCCLYTQLADSRYFVA